MSRSQTKLLLMDAFQWMPEITFCIIGFESSGYLGTQIKTLLLSNGGGQGAARIIDSLGPLRGRFCKLNVSKLHFKNYV
jgi:hypothetical protein